MNNSRAGKLKFLLVLILLVGLVSVVSARSFIVHNTSNASDIYFSVNGTTGNVGFGTSNPLSPLQLPNDAWISALNAAGTDLINMFKVNTDDEIETGGTINIGNFEFEADSGLVTFVDMPVSSTPSAGTVESYVFKLDGDNIMSIYGEADGSGGIQNTGVGIGTISPSSLLHLYNDAGAGGATSTFETEEGSGIVSMSSGANYLEMATQTTGGQLKFYTDTSTLAMTIDDNQNVGIGTANPTFTAGRGLHIEDTNAALRLATDSSGGWAYTEYRNDTGTVQFMHGLRNTDTTFRLVASNSLANSDGIILDSDGNVGIGTSSPGAQLEVESDSVIGLLIDSNYAAGNHWLLQVDSNGANPSGFWETADDMRLLLRDDTGNIDVNLYPDGDSYIRNNLGIGTESPGTELEVSSTSPIIRIRDSDTDGVAASAYIEFYDSNSRTGYIGDGSGSNSDIYVNSAEDIVLTPSGGVGIGTDSPDTAFHIQKSAEGAVITLEDPDSLASAGDPYGKIEFQGDIDTGVSFIASRIQGGHDGTVATNARQGQLEFQTSTSAGADPTTKMAILSNGNVGIGTDSPTTDLEVSGGVQVSGWTPPVSGSGIEIDGTNYIIRAYSRTGATYQPLILQGGQMYLDPVNSKIYTASGTNVGIGTTSPLGDGSDLTIGDSGTQGILHLYGSTATAYSTLKTTNGNLHIDAGYGASAADDSLYLNYYNGGDIIFGDNKALFTRSSGDLQIDGDLDVSGGDITSFNTATSDTDANFPHIVLDSTGSGDNWANQGAYISLGESGDLGSAALHMTYRGDGTSYIGSGAVSSGIPGASYIRFSYNSNEIYTPDNFYAATLDTGSGDMELGDAAVANGDTNSIPTGDQVYDFVADYIGAGGAGDIYVEKAGDTMTGDLAFGGNDITGVGTLSFTSGANHRIYSSASGLLFDGGDGTPDFLIYDNIIYTDEIRTGYSGASKITTYDSGEDLQLTSNGGDVYVNDNLGVGTATPAHTLDVDGGIRGDYFEPNADADDSYSTLRVYSGSTYAIGMKSSQTYGALNDWAMTFSMNADADRGFLWRDTSDVASDGAMSLTTGGILTLKDYSAILGGIHVGGTSDPGTDNLIVDGNVGIGTSSPSADLTVGTGTHILSSSSSVYINNSDAYGLFAVGSGTAIRANSPATVILASGGSQGVDAEGSNYGVEGSNTNTGSYGRLGYSLYSVFASGIYDFYAANSTGKSYFAGDVGIGTTTPEAVLEISTTNQAGLLLDDSGSDTPNIIFREGTVTQTWNIDKSGGDLRFFTEPSLIGGGGTVHMLIENSTGNVGIGTTSPTSTLSVGGDGVVNTGVYGYGAVYGGYFEASTSNAYGVYADGYYGGVYATGGDYGIRAILSGGSGGYGGYFDANANSASYGVYGRGTSYGVYGTSASIGVRGGSNDIGVWGDGNNYDFYAAGSGTDYGTSSSIRWKENVTNIDNALGKVLELDGVYYDWDEDHGGLHDMGFIAEDVGVVIPEVVGFEDANNESNWYIDNETGEKRLYASGVDYGALTPLLTEAIKGLKLEKDLEIENLNDKVDTSSIKINGIEADVENIKKQIEQFNEINEKVENLEKENDELKSDNEMLKSRTNEICQKLPEYNWSWC